MFTCFIHLKTQLLVKPLVRLCRTATKVWSNISLFRYFWSRSSHRQIVIWIGFWFSICQTQSKFQQIPRWLFPCRPLNIDLLAFQYIRIGSQDAKLVKSEKEVSDSLNMRICGWEWQKLLRKMFILQHFWYNWIRSDKCINIQLCGSIII